MLVWSAHKKEWSSTYSVGYSSSDLVLCIYHRIIEYAEHPAISSSPVTGLKSKEVGTCLFPHEEVVSAVRSPPVSSRMSRPSDRSSSSESFPSQPFIFFVASLWMLTNSLMSFLCYGAQNCTGCKVRPPQGIYSTLVMQSAYREFKKQN